MKRNPIGPINQMALRAFLNGRADRTEQLRLIRAGYITADASKLTARGRAALVEMKDTPLPLMTVIRNPLSAPMQAGLVALAIGGLIYLSLKWSSPSLLAYPSYKGVSYGVDDVCIFGPKGFCWSLIPPNGSLIVSPAFMDPLYSGAIKFDGFATAAAADVAARSAIDTWFQGHPNTSPFVAA